MFKKIISLSLLVTSFAMFNATFADTPATDSSKAASCACAKKMADTIQITDAQKAQIKAIRSKAKEAKESNKQELAKIKSQLKNFATTDKVDEQALDKLASQKASILAAMTKSRVMTKNAIYNVLTPEQKAQFKEMHVKWSKLDKHTHCKCSKKTS